MYAVRILRQLVYRKALTLRRTLATADGIRRKSGTAAAVSYVLGVLHGSLRELTPSRIRFRHRVAAFDLVTGFDTSGIVKVAALRTLGSNWAFGTYYRPVNDSILRTLLRGLKVDWQEFVFVDLGHGKGRAILVASEFPFLGIEGVEFCPDLHQVALRNVARLRQRRPTAPPIVLQCGDAVDYRFPMEPAVVYLYHPFEGPVMQRVKDNLVASYRQLPRKVCVLYISPLCRQPWDDAPIFVRREEGPNWAVWFTW